MNDRVQLGLQLSMAAVLIILLFAVSAGGFGSGSVRTAAPVVGDGSPSHPVSVAQKGITHDYLGDHAVEPSNLDGYTSALPANCVVTAPTASAFSCRNPEDIVPDNPAEHKTLDGYTKVAINATPADGEFKANQQGDVEHWTINLKTADTLALEDGERLRFTNSDGSLSAEGNIASVAYTPRPGADAIITVTLAAAGLETTGQLDAISTNVSGTWYIIRLGSGLETVRRDATLTGDGTPSAPMGQAPIRAGFAGALSTNPPSNDGSEIVLYDGSPSDTTDVGQNADLSAITHIRVSTRQAATGLDPGNPNTDLDAVSLLPMIEAAIAQDANAVLTFSGLSAVGNPVLAGSPAVYAETVRLVTVPAAGQTPAYSVVEFSGLTWGETATTPDQSSTAVNVDVQLATPTVTGRVSGYVAPVRSDWNAASGLAAIANKPTVPDAEQIRIDEFIDSEFIRVLDRTIVASGPAPGQALFTTGTGALANKTIFAISKDSDRVFLDNLISGDAFLVEITGTGKYLLGTITQTLDADGGADKNIVYEIDADRGVDAVDNVGAGAAKVYFRSLAYEQSQIQGDNESVTLANQYTRKVNSSSVNEFYLGGSAIFINVTPGSADDADLQRLVQPGAWLLIGGWEIAVASNYSRSLAVGVATFTFNYETLTGSAPALDAANTTQVVGEDVHRGELAGQAFRDEPQSIGGKGGTSGQVWTRGSGNGNAAWGDAYPVELGEATATVTTTYTYVDSGEDLANATGIYAITFNGVGCIFDAGNLTAGTAGQTTSQLAALQCQAGPGPVRYVARTSGLDILVSSNTANDVITTGVTRLTP